MGIFKKSEKSRELEKSSRSFYDSTPFKVWSSLVACFLGIIFIYMGIKAGVSAKKTYVDHTLTAQDVAQITALKKLPPCPLGDIGESIDKLYTLESMYSDVTVRPTSEETKDRAKKTDDKAIEPDERKKAPTPSKKGDKGLVFKEDKLGNYTAMDVSFTGSLYEQLAFLRAFYERTSSYFVVSQIKGDDNKLTIRGQVYGRK